nr:MMPL family transporter [Streptomyces diastatochromogenes]
MTAPPFFVAGSPSARAAEAVRREFPELGSEQMIAVFHSDRFTTDQPAYTHAVDLAVTALRHAPGITVVSPFPAEPEEEDDLPQHVSYLLVGVDGAPAERQDRLPGQRAAVERAARASDGRVTGHLVGVSPLFSDMRESDLTDLRTSEALAIAVALPVLLVGLRRPTATAVILLTTGIALLVAAAILAALAGTLAINVFLMATASATGLGLGLDYALLLVTRFGDERGKGADAAQAAVTAVATAGRTVAYSAAAVMGCTSTLLFVNATLIRDCVLAGLLVTAACLAATLTLLPALLTTLAQRIAGTRTAGAPNGPWARRAHHLMRRPARYLVAGVSLLLLAAAPLSDLRLGFDLDRPSLARTSAGRGLDLLEQRAPGAPGTIMVLLPGTPTRPSPDTTTLTVRLRQDPRVASTMALDNGRGATLLAFVPRSKVDSPDTRALVQHLRNTAPTGALVGGPAAILLDFHRELTGRLPLTGLLLLSGSFLFLLYAFRSLLLPLKAILANVLVTAATFGLLVLVTGPSTDAHSDAGTVNIFVPLIAMVVLFGLSMDYEVFLVRRIREYYLTTGNHARSVAAGLQDTARPITLAATVMVASFASLLTANQAELRQTGFTIAVAVAIDATLVRLVLVPALMRILGRWNWWLPRLPKTRRSSASASSTPHTSTGDAAWTPASSAPGSTAT